MTKQIQMITLTRHTSQRWLRLPHYQFAAKDALMSLTAAELNYAAVAMPLALRLQGQEVVPVAVQGLQAGENVCVGPQAQWLPTYIPLLYRLYPFSLQKTADGEWAFCVDEAHGLAHDGQAGKAFFTDAGALTDEVNGILQTLTQLEQDRLETLQACAQLQQQQLLIPLCLPQKDAELPPLETGLWQVDARALSQLSGDTLQVLQSSGALAIAYTLLLSMQHFPGLLERVELRRRAVAVMQKLRGIARSRNPYRQDSSYVAEITDAIVAKVPKVLLVTYDWSTLLEAAYLVKQAGCAVDILCPEKSPCLLNSYYDYWIDAGGDMDSLLSKLTTLVKTNYYDYVLIGDDPILWRIYRDQIADLWHLLPLRNPAAFSILHKMGFAEHCRSHQIISPNFYCLRSAADAEQALAALGLPIVLKDNYSNGGQGVSIISELAEYHAFIAAYDFEEVLFAQQYIDGELCTVDALYRDGELLQIASAVVDHPSDIDPSTKRTYIPDDGDFVAIAKQFGRSTGMHGFVNMSLMREVSTGKLYLFEADPRPTKWISYAKWFGRDLSEAFKVFMGLADLSTIQNRAATVQHWEAEHFPSHALKLVGRGQTQEVIRHLHDVERNLRYHLYDPILFTGRAYIFRNGLAALAAEKADQSK
ncbi:SapC family protein [Undibacterium danionis]|uniref:SapC family protein n=1 Tax=Undibacterium danionis TaxID=1812100 RepID=A0ABV6IH60_9BURK